ncbi:MAG TPA: TonB-dependent receptor [Woeseiaceae bacterium]|nr:TonB-dependent receptor [Woeseiaceae bacterium]
MTAQKREQSTQDIGLSVRAFEAQEFRELGLSDIGRLAALVSNLEAYGQGSVVQTFYVRGIGLNEFQGNFDSPVAVHLDEVYISKPWMISRPFFDVERVEALKGPQGTLFGRNTTGGAVNYYTRAPGTEFDAEARLSFDNHQRLTLEGYLNLPLSEHWSSRLSYRGDTGSGGPYHNRYTGDEIGEPDRQLFRGQLLWSGENTSVRLLVHGGRDRSESIPYKGPGIFNLGAPGFCPELLSGAVSRHQDACPKFAGLAPDPDGEFEPADPFTVDQDYWPRADDRFHGGYIRIEHDLGWAMLTSITAAEAYDRNQREDSSADRFEAANTDWYNEMDQFTQELRLSGDPTARWHYLAGLFYEKDDLLEMDSSNLAGNPLGITPPFAPRLAAVFDQEVESIAAFLHNELAINDAWTLTAGVRFTEDSNSIDASTFLAANDPRGDEDRVTPVIPVDALIDDRDDGNVSFKLGLDWRVRENTLLYGNVATGFRAGGYSVPFGGAIVSFDPEEVTAFEAGVKTRLAGETLQLDAAAFQYNYDDLQVNVDDPVSPLVPITRNIGESDAFGLEADLWWAPAAGLDLRFGVGYLDSEFKRTDRAITTYSGVIPLQGKRPVNTPEWNAHALLRYERQLGGGPSLVLASDVSWVDDRFLEATAQPFDRAEDYYLVNARIGLVGRDSRWEAEVWGKNVFDEVYLTYINNISFFKLDVFGEPRSYGLSLRYRFE